jgi:uncharacterized protein (DUF2147 family)
MRLPLVFAFLAFGTASALAGPVGVWRVADGTAEVQIAPCHGALCGIARGQQVLVDMKPNGANLWAGTIVDVRNGTQYAGKISMQGEALHVEGCVMGGAICGGQKWTRVR